MAATGHEVTLFASGFPGGAEEETIDGVSIVRDGNRFTVYQSAKRFYLRAKVRYDVVIDEINTVPFQTPRFVNQGERRVALLHQLAREFWFHEMPYPVAWMGYHYFEEHWLKQYRDLTTITVSGSTRKDLVELGFKDVRIVPNGLNAQVSEGVPPKTAEPSLVFVGRLKKAKRPQDAVEAFVLLKEKHPGLRLTVIGDGYMLDALRDAGTGAELLGYVDRTVRDEVVARSWAIIVPGVREGWGQVVTDSNALGTPAVGYDIPGLRDSIRDGYNGLLTAPTPAALAEGAGRLITDRAMRMRMSADALEWAKGFSWDRSAAEFEEVIKSVK